MLFCHDFSTASPVAVCKFKFCCLALAPESLCTFFFFCKTDPMMCTQLLFLHPCLKSCGFPSSFCFIPISGTGTHLLLGLDSIAVPRLSLEIMVSLPLAIFNIFWPLPGKIPPQIPYFVSLLLILLELSTFLPLPFYHLTCCNLHSDTTDTTISGKVYTPASQSTFCPTGRGTYITDTCGENMWANSAYRHLLSTQRRAWLRRAHTLPESGSHSPHPPLHSQAA